MVDLQSYECRTKRDDQWSTWFVSLPRIELVSILRDNPTWVVAFIGHSSKVQWRVKPEW